MSKLTRKRPQIPFYRDFFLIKKEPRTIFQGPFFKNFLTKICVL